jgi:hypothetical protein
MWRVALRAVHLSSLKPTDYELLRIADVVGPHPSY